MYIKPKILICHETEEPKPSTVLSSPAHECKDFEYTYCKSNAVLEALHIAVLDKYDCIITYGDPEHWKALYAMPYRFRRKWLHLTGDQADGESIYHCFINNALERKKLLPLMSVVTPVYNTADRVLYRLYDSLKAQTYKEWEWILYDDSNPVGKIDKLLNALAAMDSRIKVFRNREHIGIIGHNKRAACMLSSGEIIVEVDHDDYIMEDCLALLHKAYIEYTDCGFYYTDCTEVHENGECIQYRPGFAFGYGKYRTENYRGHDYNVYITPPINPITIRHIVGVPNHLRAWRRDIYLKLDGHNPRLYVADDYELIARTFLETRMLHIPKFLYIQYYDNTRATNTQDIRRSEIQRLVRFIQGAYENRISERILALGQEDWMRKNGQLDWKSERQQTEPLNRIMML